MGLAVGGFTRTPAGLYVPGGCPHYLWGPFKFSADQPAPLSSPYTESGAKGSLTLVQTDGQLSTSGGNLNFPAQATPAWGDQGVYSPAGLSRKAGRALLATLNFSSTTANGLFVGWGMSASASFAVNDGHAIWVKNAALAAMDAAGNGPADLAGIATNTSYQVGIVQRSVGEFLLLKGGAFGAWTVLWVGTSGATATVYANLGNNNAAGTLDTPRVVDLPGAWASDYGIATQRLAGARSAGDTFSHSSNCLIEWTETTLPSAGTTDFRFRIQDASNYWQVTIDSTGALTLNEVVAGTPTSRGSSAAAVANGNRCVIVADGTTIKVYANNTLKITYSSASNFATATSGSLTALGTSEAISDIVAWPRTVSIPNGY